MNILPHTCQNGCYEKTNVGVENVKREDSCPLLVGIKCMRIIGKTVLEFPQKLKMEQSYDPKFHSDYLIENTKH